MVSRLVSVCSTEEEVDNSYQWVDAYISVISAVCMRVYAVCAYPSKYSYSHFHLYRSIRAVRGDILNLSCIQFIDIIECVYSYRSAVDDRARHLYG